MPRGRPRFAMRTVKDGAVRIRCVTFRPNQHYLAYDGRLDGLRMCFGLYYGPKGYERYRASDGWNPTFVSLWGTEAAARSDDPDVDWPGPECVEGYLPWQWWEAA